MQMQMTDIDWRLPIAEKMEEKEAQKQLQTALHKKFESLVVASNVLKAVEKFKGLLHHVRFFYKYNRHPQLIINYYFNNAQ
jgi:hypothetical protein